MGFVTATGYVVFPPVEWPDEPQPSGWEDMGASLIETHHRKLRVVWASVEPQDVFHPFDEFGADLWHDPHFFLCARSADRDLSILRAHDLISCGMRWCVVALALAACGDNQLEPQDGARSGSRLKLTW